MVGAPRCGTTAMYEFLRAHPDIYMPPVKEMKYFGGDLQYVHRLNAPPDQIRVSKEVYLRHFDGVPEDKCAGEASSLSLVSETAAKEIHDFSPEAKIIVMLRDPVKMLYSWHGQLLATSNEDIPDFIKALDAEEDRRAGLNIPKSASLVTGLQYRKMVRYAEQLKRYIDLFGHESIKVIIYDDFSSNTHAVYRETLQFLGVNEDFKPEFRIINPQRASINPRLGRFFAAPPRILYPLAEFLAYRTPRIRGFIVSVLHLINRKEAPRPPLDPILESKLREATRSRTPFKSPKTGHARKT